MKVIIVEDNKIVAKILSAKILSFVSVEIDIANTFQEAQDLVNKKDYSLALLDLYLPDKEGSPIVDFFMSNNIPSIVMTSNLNKNLEQQINKRNIIDYVIKNRSESIDYIAHLTNRLLKNRLHTALVIDDSLVYRKEISKVLNLQLIRTITAASAQEALEILRNHKDITLVITDYEMPKTNGLEVVLAIRKTYKKYELPIIGISSQKENAISFLKYGVNDFIRKPFFNEELSTRVNNTLDSIENVKKLNNFANTDFLTGVANRKYFYQEAQKYYTQCKLSKEPFVLAMFDIDFFKKINDTYGHDVGDIVIKELAKTLKNNVKGRDIVARLGGEEFCVVLKDIDAKSAYKFFDSLREKISTLQVKTTLSHTISFTVSVGISSKPYQNFDEMVKKSDVCLYEAKSQGRNRVCIDTQECVLA